MFGRIARRYDLLNRLMTFGFDLSWRKEAIQRLELPQQALVLDLGSGTGDIAFEILMQYPDTLVVASDFTPEMIAVGKDRPGGKLVNWVIADAQYLPFGNHTFHGVISGYLLRNVSDLGQTLSEQARVLKSSGRMVSLDTTPPQPGPFRWLIELYFRFVIPLLGKWIAGEAEAYQYLPQSTENFLNAELLANKIADAGFKDIQFRRRMFGTMAIHWGKRH